ncbi:MAG: hypothetical protein ABIH42_09545 [Planctomycetota bacterium]
MKINEIKNDLEILGLKDNIYLGLLLYLSMSVRKASHKISVLVTGPAGVGKSYIAKTVLDLAPEEDVIAISRMTPAALVRQGDLSKKILYVYEKFGDEQFAQYIRELISEKKVIYETANALHELIGPTTLIETTTKPNLVNIENKSRCFVIAYNDSPQVLDSILTRQKLLRSREGLYLIDKSEEIKEKHRTFQVSLNSDISVILPKDIKYTPICTHAPRIFERIQNLISAIAFIDQGSRERITHQGKVYIEATREDFYIAKEILVNVKSDEDESIISAEIAEFLEVLMENKETLCMRGTFSVSDVVDIVQRNNFKWRSHGKIKKLLCALSELQLLTREDIRGRFNSISYRFSAEIPRRRFDAMTTCSYITLSLS